MKPVFIIAIVAVAMIICFTISPAYASLVIEGEDGGGCSDYGIWDKSTKTCTLTKNVDDFVLIRDAPDIDYNGDKKYHGVLDGMTLDGNGYTISVPPDVCANHGDPRGGLYDIILHVMPPDVTIKNLSIVGQEVECQFQHFNSKQDTLFLGIKQSSEHGMIYIDNVKISGLFSTGIMLNNGVVKNSSIHLETLSSIGNLHGIGILILGNGLIENNEISGMKTEKWEKRYPKGLYPLDGSISSAITCWEYDRAIQKKLGNDKLIISDNYIHDNDLGLSIHDRCERAIFTNNVVQDNEIGIISAGIVYQNSFIDNDVQVGSWVGQGLTSNSNNVGKFFHPEYGGNYWSDYDSSNEGCTDITHDNYCDASFTIFEYGVVDGFELIQLSAINNDDMPWNISKIWETSILHEGDITQEAISEKTPVSFSVTANRSGQTMSVSCSPNSGYEFPLGTTEVVCQTNDQRKSAFQVTVVDTIPPAINLPSDIELDALDAHGVPAEYDDVLVSDAVGIKESSCNMYSGMLFPIGENVVECTAEDTSGNITSETFMVTVVSDVPPPVIDVPENIILQANSQKGGYVTFPTIIATDPLGILEQPTCNPSSNSFFSIGTTIVECTAKNMQEYVGTQTFSVTVEPPHSFTMELLPSRDDIGTEWRSPTNKQVYNELNDRGYTPDDYVGFAESTWYGYMKGGGYDSSFLDLYIYRFDTKNNANMFYSDHVNYWSDRGGYREWNPGWNSVSAEDCYGRATSAMYTDKISLYCIKDSIVIFVTTTGNEYFMQDELSNFADGVFDNMSKVNITPSKTESNPMCGEGTVFENGQCVIGNSEGGGCLIATATYGSELAPQVQQLRELRDNQLLQTASGTAFMGTFNDIYYSFSPTIADYERENPLFKEAVKLAITPMISTLSLMENANSESEVLSIGISVIMLNLGMYLGVPAIVVIGIRKKFCQCGRTRLL